MEKQIFKKGDRVFDIRYGWGVVVELREDDFYPIRVEFKTKGITHIHYYTKDGKSTMNSLNHILSFTEYTLQNFSQERPIDYNDYIGKWGKFYDDKERSNDFVISKLVYYDEDANNDFETTDGHKYNYFEPLTEEQIKILGLE